MSFYWLILQIIKSNKNSKIQRKLKLKIKALIKNKKVKKLKIYKMIVEKLLSVSKNRNKKSK